MRMLIRLFLRVVVRVVASLTFGGAIVTLISLLGSTELGYLFGAGAALFFHLWWYSLLSVLARANYATAGFLVVGGVLGLRWCLMPNPSAGLLLLAGACIAAGFIVRHFYLGFERRGTVYRMKFR